MEVVNMAKMTKNEAHLWIHTWSATHAITTFNAKNDSGAFTRTSSFFIRQIKFSDKLLPALNALYQQSSQIVIHP